MQFLVVGVDAVGVRRELHIDGKSAAHAIAQARSVGLIPSEASLLSEEVKKACDARTAEEKRAEFEIRKSQLRISLGQKLQELRTAIEAGRRAFMYREVFVEVDSDLNGRAVANSPDWSKLRQLGLESWELVDIISRTSAITVRNDVIHHVGIFADKVGEAEAGGIGGLVNGAYLILRKEILVGDLQPDPTDELIQYLGEQYKL